jgi:carboxyl-terminal processing protease
MRYGVRGIVTVLAAAMLAGCGGGGGDGPLGDGMGGGGSGVTYTPGVYPASSGLAAECRTLRSGTDPTTGQPYRDRQGSAATENNFLRSWSHETYLWYRELPDLNPSGSNDPLAYFDRLQTSQLSSSGRDKDRFHFTFDTEDWIALSQSGIEPGYGVQWVILSGQVPRRVVASFVEPGSAAAGQNLARGIEVLEVDGADINVTTQQGVDRLNAGLFPAAAAEPHQFRIRDLDGTQRTINMTSALVQYTPVRDVRTFATTSGPVGYILFNDHNAPSEQLLRTAVQQLVTAQVTDLILDLRYNGGGYLDIASELAYMIGGNLTTGQTFELMQFNDQHPTTNPVTEAPIAPTPFHTTTKIAQPLGQPLPTLNLSRVYVITSTNTCSASEAIMNSLRGVDVTVYQIGGATCGKPFGFYPEENCSTTYFTIQFQGVNADGFGDYSDGFKPANSSAAGLSVPGCAVADDFTHPLGSELEARIAATLAFRDSNNQTCPTPTAFAPNDGVSKASQPLSATDGVMVRNPFRENRVMRRE